MAKTTVYIDGAPHTFDSSHPWNEGGEAYIYKYGTDAVLRHYRQPDDIMFEGTTPDAKVKQRIVQARLDELQLKLPAFPSNLPDRVVVPRKLAYNSTNMNTRRIVSSILPMIPDAVTMRDFGSSSYRRDNNIGYDCVLDIFKDLHATVTAVHSKGVVIGDFNNMNPLVQPATRKVYLVDSDSMQFKQFVCSAYTARYVDPKLGHWQASKEEGEPGIAVMTGRHSELSDWYAFSLMFWETWLFVPLYGGVYRPKVQQKRMVEVDERPFHSPRLSVFHEDVAYPKRGVLDYSMLPPEVVDWYKAMVNKDERQAFPERFLENLRVNGNGGAYLATMTNVPNMPVAISIVRAGAASSQLIFETEGDIVAATYHGGRLRFLYSKDSHFYREGKRTAGDADIGKGAFNPKVTYYIQGDNTILAKEGGKAVLLKPGEAPSVLDAERYREGVPVVATNEDYIYWSDQGNIWHSAKVDPKTAGLISPKPVQIGETLEDQTQIWVGTKFGFGYYSAGNYIKAFVFDAERPGRQPVDFAPLKGHILNVRCYFSDNRLWLLITKDKFGRIVNQCVLLDSDGNKLASAEVPEGHDSWLGAIDGKCAAVLSNGKLEALIAATLDGVVVVTLSGGKLIPSKPLDGTAGMVGPNDNLFYCADGLYAWDRKSIRLIKTS